IDEIASAYICLPVGTGGTAAGILRSLSPGKQLLGFSVLRGGTFLREEIQKWSGGKNENQFELLTGYAYGGYGKRDETVAAFIRDFYQQTRIPLDFIYTGKMMCGIFDLVRKQYFDRGTTI